LPPQLLKQTLILILVILLATTAVAEENQAVVIPISELEYPQELGVIERQDWGWVPITDSIAEHQISRITIHHGGVDFPDDKDVLAYLLALQSWGRSDKDWIDIPYHFMIDLQGQIYEARPINFPGDTNTTYDPTGHALIAVMGNYENQILSQKQMDSLVALIVFLTKEFEVSIENVRGHKDYAETECPGEDIYRYLQDGSIHRSVKAGLE
jgi:hypothetical protein